MKASVKEFALDKQLPRALNDEYGLYDSNQLIIVIKYSSPSCSLSYDQCCGKITIKCCQKCTSSFVLLCFLQALLHEFLIEIYKDDIHFPTSDKEEKICSQISRRIFTNILGREIKGLAKLKCSEFSTNIDFFNQKFLKIYIAEAIVSISKFPNRNDISLWGKRIIKRANSEKGDSSI